MSLILQSRLIQGRLQQSRLLGGLADDTSEDPLADYEYVDELNLMYRDENNLDYITETS